jgi:hypothetical protein
MIAVEQLTIGWGERVLMEGVDFTVAAGSRRCSAT